jgi:hypothetical protein
MIRNLMLGMSLVTLSSVSAFAAAPVAHHAKAQVVAQAPAADAPAPATDKAVKKSAKKAPKKAKTDAKTEIKSGSTMGSGETAPAVDAPKSAK